MDIHVYHHYPSHSSLDVKLDKIIFNQGKAMSKLQELNDELVAANAATNEIADDIADLMSRLDNSKGLSESEANDVKAQLVALRAKLQGVAATHTPGSTVPIEPGAPFEENVTNPAGPTGSSSEEKRRAQGKGVHAKHPDQVTPDQPIPTP